jgi:hypothetical protein
MLERRVYSLRVIDYVGILPNIVIMTMSVSQVIYIVHEYTHWPCKAAVLLAVVLWRRIISRSFDIPPGNNDELESRRFPHCFPGGLTRSMSSAV